MKNFIFKSDADFHKILFNKIDMVLAEQRHQRMDLAVINRMLIRVINDYKIGSQANQYYEDSQQREPEEDKEPD